MTTKEKIIKTIHEIPEHRLSELLSVVEEFKNKTGPATKNKWSEFAGILTDEEARIMKTAIEEEFELVEDDA